MQNYKHIPDNLANILHYSQSLRMITRNQLITCYNLNLGGV